VRLLLVRLLLVRLLLKLCSRGVADPTPGGG